MLEYFVLEVSARLTADLQGITPNSAALFFRKIRTIISWHLALGANEVLDGPVEWDESSFGGKRKGKRGRGAAGKVVVFGILKRQGKVSTVVVENLHTETLLPVLKRKIRPDSVVFTDSLNSYDVLDLSEFHHHRINPSVRFAKEKNHINGIENFWSQAKGVLRK